MPRSSFGVRFAIVAIFAVLALAFLLSPSQAQPGRPPGAGGIGGRPPGGITGMPGPGIPTPPTPPAGFGGMPGPGGITGAGGRPPGSITGMPGPGIGGGGISGMGGPGFGGTGGPGSFGPSGTVYTWNCGKCGASLGTTTTPSGPGHSRCPVCGVTFTGTTISSGPGGIGGAPSFPAGGPGMTGIPTTSPTNPAPSRPVTPAPVLPLVPNREPEAAPSSSDDSGSANDEDRAPSGRSRAIKLIGIVCGSIFLLGAIVVLAFVVARSGAPQPTRRPPPRRRVYEID